VKCSNADCNRGIGLVHHRRGWFSNRRYCSRNCRDAFVPDVPKPQQKCSATSYFEPSYYDKDGGLHAGLVPSQQNEIASHRSGLYAFSSVHHAAVGVRRHGSGH
jgi:hypothetical protein